MKTLTFTLKFVGAALLIAGAIAIIMLVGPMLAEAISMDLKN